MRQRGEIVEWNDERGFGFVRGPDGERLFLHISSSWRSGGRPRVGDHVSYLAGRRDNGKPAAEAVMLVRPAPPARPPTPRPESRSPVSVARLIVAILIACGVLLTVLLGRAPVWLPLVYVAAGTASVAYYWIDKNAAENGAWRTRESTLHAVDFVGGIAGGLVAQALLRHKTRKRRFAVTTWAIAAMHLVAQAALVFVDVPLLA